MACTESRASTARKKGGGALTQPLPGPGGLGRPHRDLSRQHLCTLRLASRHEHTAQALAYSRRWGRAGRGSGSASVRVPALLLVRPARLPLPLHPLSLGAEWRFSGQRCISLTLFRLRLESERRGSSPVQHTEKPGWRRRLGLWGARLRSRASYMGAAVRPEIFTQEATAPSINAPHVVLHVVPDRVRALKTRRLGKVGRIRHKPSHSLQTEAGTPLPHVHSLSSREKPLGV